MKKAKIKDCLPLVNGIWNHIDYEFPEIFDIDSSQLDIVFISNWSMRTAAPILKVIHSDDHTTMLTSGELDTLADIINGMYKHKWDRLMAVAEMEYDPIHNFSDHLVEEIEYSEDIDGSKSGSVNSTSTRTDNLTKTERDQRAYTDTFNTSDTETRNATDTDTHNLTVTETDEREIEESRDLSNSGDNSSADNIYGFNSSTAVGDRNSSGDFSNSESGSVTTTHSGDDTTVTSGTVGTTHTGTITNAKTGTVGRSNNGTITTTDTGTQGTVGSNTTSETSSNDTAGERTREYTKTGNIGNLSTQKLLNEEIELWKYNFILEMMRDVINFVSLPIYEQ